MNDKELLEAAEALIERALSFPAREVSGHEGNETLFSMLDPFDKADAIDSLYLWIDRHTTPPHKKKAKETLDKLRKIETLLADIESEDPTGFRETSEWKYGKPSTNGGLSLNVSPEPGPVLRDYIEKAKAATGSAIEISERHLSIEKKKQARKMTVPAGACIIIERLALSTEKPLIGLNRNKLKERIYQSILKEPFFADAFASAGDPLNALKKYKSDLKKEALSDPAPMPAKLLRSHCEAIDAASQREDARLPWE